MNPARTLIATLLARRAPGATICPSEVARALLATAGSGSAERDWRGLMPVVHAAVDALLDDGQVRLSWKTVPLSSRTGPYRIGIAERPAAKADIDEAKPKLQH